MKKYLWLLTLAIFLLHGCIPSIYPLYSEDKLVFEELLIGEWREDGDVSSEASGQPVYPLWHFERGDEDGTYYTLIHTSEEGKTSSYEVHLVKLGDLVYFDFYPDGDENGVKDLDDFLQIHLFPVHTFAKVELSKEKVVFHMFDTDWLAKLIEQRKIRIRHEETDGMLLLSAGTEELQQFVEKYGHDDKAYVDPVVLLRNK